VTISTSTASSLKNSIQDAIKQYNQDEKWLLSLIRGDAARTRALTQADRLAAFQNRFQTLGRFLDFAGNPQHDFRSVHVAGTSGKGSVTLMISALLTAAGQRTGDHISPYLQICNEKLRINGEMIAPSKFSEIIDRLRILHGAWVAKGETLRYGSAWVALTFLWFAHMEMDWGVIETGMGGRLNGTNHTPSDLAVITNVNYDHVVSLGPTLADIAWHKAGIIKPGQVAVTAETKPQILDILYEEARQKEAMLYQVAYKTDVSGILTVTAPHRTYDGIDLATDGREPGRHHCENVATSITAFDLLAHKYGFTLSNGQIQQTLADFTFPGRLEIMQTEPLIVLDGAHNPHKMASLIRTLRQQYPTHTPLLIFGMLATKDARDVIAEISGYCRQFIVTEPHVYQKKARPCAEVATMIQAEIVGATTELCSDIQDALDLAFRIVKNQQIIIVTGSVYLVGEARERWYPRETMLEDLEHIPT